MQTRTNYRWFSDKLREKGLSQRKLASLLGMDPSSLSLLLHGKRKMKIEHASSIARILGVPVDVVIRQAGVHDAAGNRLLPLVGWVDGESRAHVDFADESHRIDVPGEYPPLTVAVQYRTAQSGLELYDGWVLVVTEPQDPSPTMLDKLCLVGLANGETHLRTVRRGFGDRYTLLAQGAAPLHGVEVRWFAPVLMIAPK